MSHKMKPILFSTPMVQAILNGRKTQTRRVIREVSDINNIDDIWSIGRYKEARDGNGKRLAGEHFSFRYRLKGDSKFYDACVPLKYIEGDILWVRETWNGDWCDHVIYKADGGSAKAAGYSAEPKWKPSIFMPREASRLFLRVKDVRIERLQDISIADAKAEGKPEFVGKIAKLITEHVRTKNAYIADFAGLWDSINDKRGYGWNKNPWVWVYEFERIEKP